MGKAKRDIRIGTSGWYYDHWRERFYPPGLAKSKWFEHYAQQFNTVEINNTFYHLPTPQTLTRWCDLAPEGFLYAVKANRYITHIKRLKDTAEEVKRFFNVVGLLKEKLGPILYQLPPSIHKDHDLLGSFIKLLPRKSPAVFEFRHKSWYEEDTFELLGRLGAGFCIHDLGELTTPRIITGEMVYIRFHGTAGRYSGNYTDKMLADWANWLKEQTKNARAIYAYFNNDADAHAINNATTLKRKLRLPHTKE
jgi:uncharacterized protein YecE (DUF72 family)